ncbi:hypothetical protein, partial [Haloparvum sedimenti]|uniref:hypothetical protein n=1 Tax=Haloparvum sedimenti TaxID=1678448 RepID=UPI001C3FFE28
RTRPDDVSTAAGGAESEERSEARRGRAGWGFLGGVVPRSRICNRHKNRVQRAGWGFLGVAVPSSSTDSSHKNTAQ